MKRRRFMQGLLLAGLIGSPAVSAEVTAISVGSAINKAGRQRMLTQRMAKAYTMRLLDVNARQASQLQELSRTLFETQLQELRTLQPTAEIRGALDTLDAAWQTYRKVLSSTPAASELPALMAESERTLVAAHALTGLYEKQAGTAAGRLVNISGRQRMLSQRLAKCYFLHEAGIRSDNLSTELGKAHQEFVAALATLNKAPENTAEIRQDLQLADTQWLFFDQALNGREQVRTLALRNVATTSERILEVMDGVTGRYERLVRA